MSTLKPTAYIVHTQIIGLGNRPFPPLNRIRAVWHPLFNSKDCFTDLYSLIQDARHWDQDQERIPSKPFIQHLGSIYFTTRSVRLVYGRDDRSVLAEHLGGEQYTEGYAPAPFEENETDDYFTYAPIFGFDKDLEDQRMNYLYFEVRKPLFLKAETTDDTRADGKVFIHIYPSGYLSLQVAVSLAWQKDRRLNDVRTLIQETRPWRRDTQWIWSSRLGTGTLSDVVERVKSKLRQSLYVDNSQPLREGPWLSALKLASDADAQRIALEVMLPRGQYDVLDLRSTDRDRSNCKGLVASRQGILCVAPREHKRKQALTLFWRILTLAEFVAFKQRVYDDYADFLRPQVQQLREFRLSIRRKLTKEDLFRFSVYDQTIPQFLAALDAHIRAAKPFHRRIYTSMSVGTGFDAQRERVMELVEDWEKEVEQWEPSLSLLWKRVISPIRSLLGH